MLIVLTAESSLVILSLSFHPFSLTLSISLCFLFLSVTSPPSFLSLLSHNFDDVRAVKICQGILVGDSWYVHACERVCVGVLLSQINVWFPLPWLVSQRYCALLNAAKSFLFLLFLFLFLSLFFSIFRTVHTVGMQCFDSS